jgi:hypothetical protein
MCEKIFRLSFIGFIVLNFKNEEAEMNCVSEVLISFTTPEYHHEIKRSPVEHKLINSLLSHFIKR